MKKILLSIFAAFIGMLNLNAQNVTIPDANFKAYLVGNTSINTNADAEIQVSEATVFTGAIGCNSLNISDLTGIEAFVSLNELICGGNQLTTLNLSSNTNLTGLYCQFNLLSSLNVSANTALTHLYCYGNSLTSLNISTNTALTNLICSNNQITSLDASSNTALTYLDYQSNELSTLDLSSNPALTYLDCQFNELTTLNVANGNNMIISSFYLEGNPHLTCIEVDNATYSTNNWTYVDNVATFNVDCNTCVINIPDANFKAYLVGHTSINTNSDTQIQCTEAASFTGQIWVQALGITNLTGIEAFTNLTSLNCSSNSLTSIDVSDNTSLVVLNIVGNQISAIDVSNNLQLSGLYCDYNQLTTIDVSANVNLTELSINNNDVSQLDISANVNLIELGCESNSLTDLNAANGNNINFTAFYATGNPDLTCIKVDDAAYSNTNWTSIDATASFSENCSLGIEEFNAVTFSVYPNPVSIVLSIDSDVKIESVRIFDLNGMLIQSETSAEFSVENLENGMYIVTVTTEQGVASKRFVKN